MAPAGNEAKPVAADGQESAHLQVLKALADPVLLELLAVLSDRDISPAEFARMRSEPVSNVASQFRILEELGRIELAETKQVPGSTEHFYRRTQKVVFDDDAWLLMPDEARQIIASSTVRDLFGRMARALQAGTFTARDDMFIGWDSYRLDETGWKRTATILREAFSELAEVEKEAAKRLAKAGEDGIVATVALAGFESPQDVPNRAGEDEFGSSPPDRP